MLQFYQDLVKEFGIFPTWARVAPDFLTSVFTINLQHFMEKSSLQIKLALGGTVLVLPFVLLVVLSLMGRAFGFSANSVIGPYIAHNFRLAFFMLIVMPLLAFILNLIPLAQNAFSQKNVSEVLSLQFVRVNLATLAVAAVGIGAVVFLLGHDAIPCLVNGLINQHFHNFLPLVRICRDA